MKVIDLQKYIRTKRLDKPLVCPHCENRLSCSIDGIMGCSDGKSWNIDAYCESCDKSWTLVYSLVNIISNSEPKTTQG